MKKKVLVLGIGPSQVDLIHAAKEMGFEVYACAANSNGPGIKLVDKFKEIDIKNISAVKQYAADNKVDFIYTMALEAAIEPITKISEELNLPSYVSLSTLDKLNDKSIWRTTLGNIDGNVLAFSGNQIDDFQFWEVYPAILKPVDGSGQRGVYKVNNFSEVAKVFDSSIQNSKKHEVIIEEYVDGPEISVNSFMINGELKFALISDRISYKEYPGGIIKEHHLPSRIIDDVTEKKIYNLVNKVNDVMGLKNGHIYFQIKLQNNEPKLIEFTPRFDGCHMWRLILESTGIDLRKAALEWLATEKCDELEKENLNISPKYLKTVFVSDKPGILVDKEKYNIPKDPIYLEWYYDNGQKVKSVTGHLEKIGYYIIEE